MMLRTATVQANLDFSDEADAAAKMRCLYSVTSILTALWAASPIVDEKAERLSELSRVDLARHRQRARRPACRSCSSATTSSRAYTEWALDVPMYFIYRGGYLPVPAGLTFRAFMRDGYAGQHATLPDWALHLSTLFPEGRLKKFIEVRGCDCGSLAMIEALAPMMRGLLYDATARTAATALTAELSFAERQRSPTKFRAPGSPRAPATTRSASSRSELVAIAQDGLSRVAPASVDLLAPVEEIATTGRTQSDRIIELWQRARRQSPRADPRARASRSRRRASAHVVVVIEVDQHAIVGRRPNGRRSRSVLLGTGRDAARIIGRLFEGGRAACEPWRPPAFDCGIDRSSRSTSRASSADSRSMSSAGRGDTARGA